MAKLGEVCIQITDGSHNPPSGVEQSEYLMLSSKNIDDDFITLDSPRFLSHSDYIAENKRTTVSEGDLLMTIVGTIGRVAIVPKELKGICLQRSVAVIKPEREVVNNRYLMYQLQNMRPFLEKEARGVAQKGIYLKQVSQLDIKLPELEHQMQIVKVLDKASKLIFLRRQQLAKLDELVKARFVEMFGDEQAFNKEPLSQNVEEMFIGPFGSSLKNENFVSKENGYCMVYEQKHAIRKTMDVETRYIDKPKYEELKRFSIHGGDIIVSCRGTIGETYIVPLNAPLGIMHPSIMKIRVKDSIYNRVFFDFLLQEKLKQHEAQANGSGVKMAVTASALGKEEFIVPSIPFQNQFAAFVERVDQQKQTVQQSLEKLELMKKALMQEYFG